MLGGEPLIPGYRLVPGRNLECLGASACAWKIPAPLDTWVRLQCAWMGLQEGWAHPEVPRSCQEAAVIQEPGGKEPWGASIG